MIKKSDFEKINEYLWQIPKTFRQDMRVPARAYISEKMLEESFKDRSLDQLVNVSTLPGIINYALAMPDMHEGYGFPIGGVAALDIENGVISPGGVGYDINCGMKLLKSDYATKDIKNYLDKLAGEIQKQVPSGLGKGRQIKLDIKTLEKILEGGAKKLVELGYGEKEDIENCEAQGNLNLAQPELVSDHAKDRGRDQVGTLGSGNHFLEIQRVDEIFDENAASVFGIFLDQVVVMIHTGSRGLGHQIATDYIKIMMGAMEKYGISLPDLELAACPFNSKEGQNYFYAMCAGANFAWANRQMIAFYIRKAWENILGKDCSKLTSVYDVAHNIAKIENHLVSGKEMKLIVHRKGATRSFGPGHLEIPEKYRQIGQPVLIPGSMGTASYILVGTKEADLNTFGSTCHGAGRAMSRHAATRAISGRQIITELEAKGILVKSDSFRGLA
ncbi:MAG: RtcB family protein, partial [Candidatus Pacebacteria bacterium]|nr:RtcB family protein [Candidatus Paceibacterota bacterium]